MKITFDHQIFALQARGGISRYFVRLAQALNAQNAEARIIAPMHQNLHLAEARPVIHRGLKVPSALGKVLPFADRANGLLSEHWLRQAPPDLIHHTYYPTQPAGHGGIPRVVTVHDMIPEKFPHMTMKENPAVALKKHAVMLADHVICVSEHTKQDLCELYELPPNKVSVVHHGQEVYSVAEEPISRATGKSYLLYVGQRGGYKNFACLLKAVAANPRLRADMDIVAFGGGQLTRAELNLVQTLGLSASTVRQVDGSDDLLCWHYRQAAALVYPSFYEGFGMPPLEAMSQGCPVVSSSASAMPEIIGNAGTYFDPNSPEDLSRAIETVLSDDRLRADLTLRGRERVAMFTWEQCAKRTLAVYATLRP
jgi:glycosyltransferase involved in cell wall biosynthesis